MKIILNQDVENIGEEGDIVEVANGYARNYLLPRKLAVPYTRHNEHILQQRRRTLEKKREEKRQHALGLKERIEELDLVIPVPAGESGRLFGSVNNATIARELEKHDVTIDRRRINVPDHSIRELGAYTIDVRLYGEEKAQLKVRVERAEQREEQEQDAERG